MECVPPRLQIGAVSERPLPTCVSQLVVEALFQCQSSLPHLPARCEQHLGMPRLSPDHLDEEHDGARTSNAALQSASVWILSLLDSQSALPWGIL